MQPFNAQTLKLATDLSTVRNQTAAAKIVKAAGKKLWEVATLRAQTKHDDRPLYWTRLKMIQKIRKVGIRLKLNTTMLQALANVFENASRGMTSADFSTVASGDKRILITGFDPFALNSNIQRSNPSGAVALALDGQRVVKGSIAGRIESAIFPVRFRDFNQGMVENFVRPRITGSKPVHMVMTISLDAGASNYEIERWAGRNRTNKYQDNENRYGDASGPSSTQIKPPGLTTGSSQKQFYETKLPHAEMTKLPGVILDSSRSPASGTGAAISGSGGSYLSNEIFYRSRLLQENIGGKTLNIKIGHLHVPAVAKNRSQADIIQKVKDIIIKALPSI